METQTPKLRDSTLYKLCRQLKVEDQGFVNPDTDDLRLFETRVRIAEYTNKLHVQ